MINSTLMCQKYFRCFHPLFLGFVFCFLLVRIFHTKENKLNTMPHAYVTHGFMYIFLLHTMFQFRLVHVGSLGVTSPYCLRDVSQPCVLDDAEEPIKLVLCHTLLNVEQNALNFGLVVQRWLWK